MKADQVPGDTWGGTIFLFQKHYLKKNIKALGLVVSDEHFFMFLPIKAYVKRVTLGAGPFLAPGALFEHTW